MLLHFLPLPQRAFLISLSFGQSLTFGYIFNTSRNKKIAFSDPLVPKSKKDFDRCLKLTEKVDSVAYLSENS